MSQRVIAVLAVLILAGFLGQSGAQGWEYASLSTRSLLYSWEGPDSWAVRSAFISLAERIFGEAPVHDTLTAFLNVAGRLGRWQLVAIEEGVFYFVRPALGR